MFRGLYYYDGYYILTFCWRISREIPTVKQRIPVTLMYIQSEDLLILLSVDSIEHGRRQHDGIVGRPFKKHGAPSGRAYVNCAQLTFFLLAAPKLLKGLM